MAATNPGFEVVGGTETDVPAPAAPQATPMQIVMLTLALKALSQRALTAISDLFTITTCAGVWYLWYLTPSPTYQQIVSLSIFALFVLAANVIVRRK